MTGRVTGMLLDDSDARTTLEALEVFVAEMAQRGQRPSARLSALISKYAAYARASGDTPPRNARDEGVQADSGHPKVYAIVDTAEAARILGITPNGVRDRARRGAIPARRAGGRWIYPAADVIALAERRAPVRGGIYPPLVGR